MDVAGDLEADVDGGGAGGEGGVEDPVQHLEHLAPGPGQGGAVGAGVERQAGLDRRLAAGPDGLDVYAGAAVDLGRVLAREQRDLVVDEPGPGTPPSLEIEVPACGRNLGHTPALTGNDRREEPRRVETSTFSKNPEGALEFVDGAPPVETTNQHDERRSAEALDAEVRALFAETKAMDEDYGFILGSGVGMPQGILNMSGIATVPSGAANGQSYGGIVSLFTSLPAQYRPRATWLMNSLTYGLILQQESSGGMVLFPPNTLPNTLFGRPIDFSEWMPDGDTDDNKAIVFGDFSYYAIVDRTDLRVQRLTERFAPNIGLLATARVGGQPLKIAPFRIQEVGAS